jgi:hypothetical protein
MSDKEPDNEMSEKCQTSFSVCQLIVATFAKQNLRSMMQQTTFSRVNTCVAWLMFAIAAVVYGLTVEPTASLWGCRSSSSASARRR